MKVMTILEEHFPLLASEEVVDAFTNDDWCELGRLLSVQIEVEMAMKHQGTWQ